VLNTEEERDTVKIIFLQPNRRSLSYRTPTTCTLQEWTFYRLTMQDILMQVDLCTATGRVYTFRAQKNDIIDKKHASFHRLLSGYCQTTGMA
jgi:hypothetical protein